MHVYVNLIVPYLLISYEMYDAYKSYFYIVLLYLYYIQITLDCSVFCLTRV